MEFTLKTYQPKPLDTSTIDLPEGLQSLTEKLAENTHENWAQLRIKEGWKYGDQRDDDKKTHPDLVPYHQLSDSEKEYDRMTAMETVKAIVALGYRVDKK